MVITSARLQNYRSYIDSSFEFSPGVNIIVGPNASGKTNLLDAIYYVSQGKPVKKATKTLVRNGASWARIDILTNSNQSRTVKITDNSAEIIIDEISKKRLNFIDKIPVVLFEPGYLHFLTTSPDMRRSFLDEVLLRTNAAFSSLRRRYLKALGQRNALLKQSPDSIKKQIFAWDIRLSELAGSYAKLRLEAIAEINSTISSIYSSIANNSHTLNLEYDTKLDQASYANAMLKSLEKDLHIDQHRGFTGAGPHRDDIRIIIDGNDMRDSASRGETRSILLALKIIESNIIERVLDQKPLLLLDDVFGELDGVRRKALTSFIGGNQVFITTTDADIVTHKFTSNATVLTVS